MENVSSNVNNFGVLAFHVNSKSFGSSTEPGTPDNALDFKNINLQVYPGIPPGCPGPSDRSGFAGQDHSCKAQTACLTDSAFREDQPLSLIA